MSAPVLLACGAACLLLALPVAGAASAVEAERRATGAADSAALAAADALVGWVSADPCEIAEAVAEAAEVRLFTCEVDWEHSQIRIIVSVQTIFGTAHARARAGPPVA